MSEHNEDIKRIKNQVNLYFKGTYQGDISQLERAFHPQARITGLIDQQYFDWTLAEFTTRVTAKPTAENKNEPYDKEIIFVDKVNNAAMVKARVVVGSLVFIDYITLLKINGEWIIRNKSFTVEN